MDRQRGEKLKKYKKEWTETNSVKKGNYAQQTTQRCTQQTTGQSIESISTCFVYTAHQPQTKLL